MDEALREKLKSLLLNTAEDLARNMLKEVLMPLAQQKILESENKIDDILLPFLGEVEKALDGLVDKIDGEEG